MFHFVLFCLKIVQRNWGCHFLVDPRGSTRNSRMEAVLSVQKCLSLSIFASFLEFLWENCQRKLRSSTPSFNMFAKKRKCWGRGLFSVRKLLEVKQFCFNLWNSVRKLSRKLRMQIFGWSTWINEMLECMYTACTHTAYRMRIVSVSYRRMATFNQIF